MSTFTAILCTSITYSTTTAKGPVVAPPLPTPSQPPTASGRRIIGSLERRIAEVPDSAEAHAAKVVDLLHIYSVVRAAIDPAMAAAVDPSDPKRSSLRKLSAATSLSKSAVQDRVRRHHEAVAPPEHPAVSA
jgi:hypothetical protein